GQVRCPLTSARGLGRSVLPRTVGVGLKRQSGLIESPSSHHSGTTVAISVIAVVVAIYGMQAARVILVPFLVAVFIAILCTPILRSLERMRIPTGIAVAMVIILIIGIVTLAGTFVGGSIGAFNDRLPFYQARLNERFTDIAALVGQEVTVGGLLNNIQPGAAMGLAANLLNALQGLLANFFLIMFTVVFILLEASSMPSKMQLVLSASRGDPEYFRRFTGSVQRYLGIKTLTSLATGITVGLLTAAFGLDFPILWGLLAFLLNYVPNIGSLIAAIPAVFIALIQFSLLQALMITLGYFVINITIGGVIEPRVMGRGLGLSTLIVFLSLIFWGWIFGPMGMLLAVPLTMTAKIALESSERTAAVALLLSAPERAQ
ncbi:MAG: AI-2E family transporter, partial [Rhodospirillaceae bacterium]|nr:AI-2E family transporter [Rhodospirillaceae bacterium]